MKNKIIIRKLCIVTLSLVILFSCTGMALGAEKTVRSDNTEFFQDIVDEYNELYGLDIGFGGFIDKNKDISVEEFRKEVEALAINQQKAINMLSKIKEDSLDNKNIVSSLTTKGTVTGTVKKPDVLFSYSHPHPLGPFFYVQVTYSANTSTYMLSNPGNVRTEANQVSGYPSNAVAVVHQTSCGVTQGGTTVTAGQKVDLVRLGTVWYNVWLAADFYAGDLI